MSENAQPVEGYKVLTLDLGTNTGWCFSVDGVIKYSGTKAFTKTVHPGKRFDDFDKWLCKFHGINEIIFERVEFTKFTAAAHLYGAWVSHLMAWSYRTGTKISSIDVSKVKKLFTGKGNASKTLICNTAIDMGWANGKRDTERNNNEADAIAIFTAIMKVRGLEVTFSRE